MTLRPRLLVLRGGAIGDFVLTLPVLQALRARWPESHLEVVGYPHIAGLARAAGWADRVESLVREHRGFDRARRRALGRLRHAPALGCRRPASRDELHER